MNKKIYILLTTVIATVIILSSCGSGSSNSYAPSEEWIALQEAIYAEIAANDDYTEEQCFTQNGKIYYKPLTGNEFPEVTPPSRNTKITSDGYPYFNDTVKARYLGWYYYEDSEGNRKKFYFDGTETNLDEGYEYNKQTGVDFTLSELTSGFSSMLQYMKVGDKVEVCIPYQLGYGEYGNLPSGGVIRGRTTLFFNIYLMRIYPVNPGEFPGANTGQ